MSSSIIRMTQAILALLEFLLVARFLSRLLGASGEFGFVTWLYDTTYPLIAPFEYVFPSESVHGRFAIEFTTLFAVLAYSFGAYVLIEIVSALSIKEKGIKK
jgi:hypothetical protein